MRTSLDLKGLGADLRLYWSPASLLLVTIKQRREASLDGSMRLLRISVSDKVQYLNGRKVRDVPSVPRWRDDYKVWRFGTEIYPETWI